MNKNNMNYTWGILLIIAGIIELYYSYEKTISYLSNGKISFVIKYMRFTGNEALLLNNVNIAFGIILIYFGFMFTEQRTQQNIGANKLPSGHLFALFKRYV